MSAVGEILLICGCRLGFLWTEYGIVVVTELLGLRGLKYVSKSEYNHVTVIIIYEKKNFSRL